MINFYDQLPKNMRTKKLYNKETGMNIPFRLLLLGSSGSGKTNTLLNIVKLHSGIYHKIVLCTKQIDEPLYKYLISKAGDQVEIVENLQSLQPPEFYASPYKDQVLVIFDDMCLEKDKLQDRISEFWIRGRKLFISCAYLSQSFAKTPITIRRNCNYMIIKKLANNRDIVTILKDYSLGNINSTDLINLYKEATKDYLDFLFIDIDAPNEKKFRKGFNEILEL